MNKPTKVQILQDLDTIDDILKFNEDETQFSSSDSSIIVFSNNEFYSLSEFSDMSNFGVISRTIRKVARKAGDAIKGNDVFPFNQTNVGRLLTDSRFRVDGGPEWKSMTGMDLTNAKDYFDMKGFKLASAWYDSNVNNWEVNTQKRTCYFWYLSDTGEVLSRGSYTPPKSPDDNFRLRIGKKYPARDIKEIAVSRSGNLKFRDRIR